MSSINYSKPFFHESMDTRELFAGSEPPGGANSNHSTPKGTPKGSLPDVRLPGSRVFTLDFPSNENIRRTPENIRITPQSVRKTPNKDPPFSWKESFDLREFGNGELWKHAVLEGSGTCLLVWLTGLATYSLVPTIS